MFTCSKVSSSVQTQIPLHSGVASVCPASPPSQQTAWTALLAPPPPPPRASCPGRRSSPVTCWLRIIGGENISCAEWGLSRHNNQLVLVGSSLQHLLSIFPPPPQIVNSSSTVFSIYIYVIAIFHSVCQQSVQSEWWWIKTHKWWVVSWVDTSRKGHLKICRNKDSHKVIGRSSGWY